MLTPNETKWLQARITKVAPCGAKWSYCRDHCGRFTDAVCLLNPDYRDAAEFEARVAVIAVNIVQPCLVADEHPLTGGACPEGREFDCLRNDPCFIRCGLKYARLFVESVLDDAQNECADGEGD